jgi:SPX domain protein involved in polyphosphate accumulation
MQTSRFELKYVVNEELALQIRDFARCHLDLDENSIGKPDFSYPVHSLYLDSDALLTYWNTINGDRNRFKLRIRFYNEDPETPVFFEIKRRVNNSIKKQRAGVRREAVNRILAGQLPDIANFVSKEPKHMFAMQEFIRLMQQVEARPMLHVAYRREAYMPREDNSARLTLDRDVRSEPDPAARLSTRMRNPRVTWGKAVILELKFTNRFPNWFAELVRVFNLRPSGAAKYVDGLAHHSSRAIFSTTGRRGRKNAEIENHEITCLQL